MMRQRSLQEDTMTGKVVAALRNGFGGHDVEQKNNLLTDEKRKLTRTKTSVSKKLLMMKEF